MKFNQYVEWIVFVGKTDFVLTDRVFADADSGSSVVGLLMEALKEQVKQADLTESII